MKDIDDILAVQEMPFTQHSAEALFNTLESIKNCPLPVEVFDAFLFQYAKERDLVDARFFAQCEWGC